LCIERSRGLHVVDYLPVGVLPSETRDRAECIQHNIYRYIYILHVNVSHAEVDLEEERARDEIPWVDELFDVPVSVHTPLVVSYTHRKGHGGFAVGRGGCELRVLIVAELVHDAENLGKLLSDATVRLEALSKLFVLRVTTFALFDELT